MTRPVYRTTIAGEQLTLPRVFPTTHHTHAIDPEFDDPYATIDWAMDVLHIERKDHDF